MEALQVLEQKISQLIALIKELKNENGQLKEHNYRLEEERSVLAKKLESMEVSLLSNKESLTEEKELARFAVDELIKSIDSLVGNEQQS